MPYPVQPPQLPPIVDFSLTEHRVIPDWLVSQAVPKAQGLKKTALPRPTAPLQPVRPTRPEKFTPENSVSGSPRQAKLLGPGIAVGLQPETPIPVVQFGQVPASLLEPTLEPVTELETPEHISPAPESGIIELSADRQTYSNERQVATGEGNVRMRFRGSFLRSDRVQLNLPNRNAVAEGNVVLTRGTQVLQGQRFEYNFVQGTGTIFQARGTVNSAPNSQDFNPNTPADVSARLLLDQSLGDRIAGNQPPYNLSSPGEASIFVGAGRDAPQTPTFSGSVGRIRYEADRINFDGSGWTGENVRLTNDPFSPPELEVRADRARLTRLSETEDLLETENSRLVFDQSFEVPLFQSRNVLSRRRKRDQGLVRIGYDTTDRGGLFLERTFEVYTTDQFTFSLTPQLLVERGLSGGGDNSLTSPSAYGLIARAEGTISPSTSVQGTANFSSLDLNQIENRLRASLRIQQAVPIGSLAPHTLSLESSYRDRLFNGSLGFQDVQSSLGAVLLSPTIALGDNLNLRYQLGVQFVNADTDRTDLLAVSRPNNRISLTRYQAAADLGYSFYLWQGAPLPATPEAGLKYTSRPVVPYLQLQTGLNGTTSGYSSGDSQQVLTGSIGLFGQLGHFSAPFFDYTGFNVTYSQGARTGLSPFLCDRAADTRVLSGGLLQQLYGPFRLGFQTSYNLDTGREISTDYILEYSRRSYGIVLRYNPVLQFGSLGVRISDFNWSGGTEPFSEAGVRSVERGVRYQE